MRIVGSPGSSSGAVGIGTATIRTFGEFNYCHIITTNTNANPQLTLGPTLASATIGPKLRFLNTKIVINNNSVQTRGMSFGLADIFMSSVSIAYSGVSKPNGLMNIGGGSMEIVDSDLSGYEKSGGLYVNMNALYTGPGRLVIRNCKLSSLPGLIGASPWNHDGLSATIINSSATASFVYATSLGTITATTSIYYPSGALYKDQGVSWQIVTSSMTSEAAPFITPWMSRWSDTLTSSSGTFAIVSDSATALTDRQIWGEIEYVSSTTFPLGGFISQRSSAPFDASTPTSWGSDTNVWVGTSSFSNVGRLVMTSTFTPTATSLVRGRVVVGLPNYTLYLDPTLILSGEANNPSISWTDQGSVIYKKVPARAVAY